MGKRELTVRVKDAVILGFDDEFGCMREGFFAAMNLARFELIWGLQLWDRENNN